MSAAGAQLSYRPDIDGLRAVAMAAVVAFHYFPESVTGGFVGVDVFFVISGFLITSLLAKEIAGGGIAYGDFYARRARRLFPALALVLGFTLLAGSVLLTPEAFRALGLEAAAGAVSAANLLFWAQSGYFDAASETKPLLHLWSLAVEEQFYLIWPLGLALAARARIPLAGFAAGVGVLSFVVGWALTASAPAAGFYFVGARLWELAMGAALALGGARLRGRQAETAAVAGTLAIFAGVVWLAPGQPFPGWRALVPTFGAALVIAAGPAAFVNRAALASRPMVWLGRISYPLYLWHWPLLVFARVHDGGGTSGLLRWLLIGLALALAQATYERLEKPIRFGARPGRKTAGGVAALVAMAAVGVADWRRGGLLFPGASFIQVVHEGDIGSQTFVAAVERLTRPCPARFQPDKAAGDFGGAACVQSKADTAPEILIVGDSHGHQALLGLAEALPERNVGYIGGADLHVFATPENRRAFAALAAEPGLKAVLFAARWSERRRRFADREEFAKEIAEAVAVFRAAGKRVILLLDTPGFRFSPQLCKYYEPVVYVTRCEAPRSEHERVKAESLGDLKAIAVGLPRPGLWNPTGYFCDAETCSMARGRELLYRDENHLGLAGSRYLAQRLLGDHPEIADPAAIR